MKNKLILKYIFFISVVFFIFLIGRSYYDKQHQSSMLQKNMDNLFLSYKNRFELSKEALIDKYQTLSTHYINSKKVYTLFKNKKREELYTLLQQDYKDFQSIDKDLFVMHFMDRNNITTLRMHKLESFDDNLTKKRPIVAYANKSQKKQFGFEVGKNGIVYRVTTPFIHKGDHIGVLEFGIKLNYFTTLLTKGKNTFSSIVVKTKNLDNLIAKKDYNTIGQYSIVSQEHLFNELFKDIDINKDKQIITKNDKHYMVFGLILENFNNHIVSKIFIAQDISTMVEQNQTWFNFINTISILVYLLVLVTMYLVLVKFSDEIKEHLDTISLLHTKSNKLQTQADTDELTQVYNKRFFDTYFKNFLSNNQEGTLLFFDIDHFKQVNDTHGHLAGDQILKNLTHFIKKELRSDDILARWGGEEFVLILHATDFENGYAKAEFLRKLIEKTDLYRDIKITISIGIIEINPQKSTKYHMKRVDDLLYRAKTNGRNQTCCQ